MSRKIRSMLIGNGSEGYHIAAITNEDWNCFCLHVADCICSAGSGNLSDQPASALPMCCFTVTGKMMVPVVLSNPSFSAIIGGGPVFLEQRMATGRVTDWLTDSWRQLETKPNQSRYKSSQLHDFIAGVVNHPRLALHSRRLQQQDKWNLHEHYLIM